MCNKKNPDERYKKSQTLNSAETKADKNQKILHMLTNKTEIYVKMYPKGPNLLRMGNALLVKFDLEYVRMTN